MSTAVVPSRAPGSSPGVEPSAAARDGHCTCEPGAPTASPPLAAPAVDLHGGGPGSGGPGSGAMGGEPTLAQLLAPTGLPALLDRTPSELAALLAPAGLPDLPATPPLDPMGLLAPMSKLLGTFGTGTLPGGADDPAAMLTGLSQVLQTGVGAATAAAQALSGRWTGQSGPAAAGKATLSAADAGALAAQGAAMATNIQGGVAIVGTGLAALQGVIVKTAGLLTATLPAIATPPGQLAALGIATEGLTEALAVVAGTRAQLAVPTAKMAADGAKVPVTPPPISPDQLGGLIQAALPLISAGLQAVGTLAGSAGAVGAPGVRGAPVGTAPMQRQGAEQPCPPATTGTPAAPGAAARETGGVPPTVQPAGLGAVGTGAGGLGSGGLGAVGATPSAEPQLGARPLSAEPLTAPSVAQAPVGSAWAKPAGLPMTGPMAPMGPAVASPGAARPVVDRSVPFDVGPTAPTALPVLGETPPPPVSVDVDFLLTDAQTAV